jgi:hypothetical protein
MQRESIFVGVDGDGSNAQFVGAAENANGDFAAVGSQNSSNGKHEMEG